MGDGASAGFAPEQQGTGQAGREGAPEGLDSEDAAESEVLPPAVGNEPLGCSGPRQVRWDRDQGQATGAGETLGSAARNMRREAARPGRATGKVTGNLGGTPAWRSKRNKGRDASKSHWQSRGKTTPVSQHSEQDGEAWPRGSAG